MTAAGGTFHVFLGHIGGSPPCVAVDSAAGSSVRSPRAGFRPCTTALKMPLQVVERIGCRACGCEAAYPRLRPEDFSAEGFVFPSRLQHTSFRPLRLLKSCLKRLWMDRFA